MGESAESRKHEESVSMKKTVVNERLLTMFFVVVFTTRAFRFSIDLRKIASAAGGGKKRNPRFTEDQHVNLHAAISKNARRRHHSREATAGR